MSSPGSQQQDSCSIESVIEGPASFDRLFNHFHAPLVRFVSKQLNGSRIDPEDVVQETMTKAWANRESFDPRYRFSTWVYTIARRTALDHLRCRRVKVVALEDISEPTQESDASLSDTESASQLWRVAETTLSPDQYAALWLRYGEEMTVGEVAKAIAKSTVSTRVLLHRARTKLRTSLRSNQRSEAPNQERGPHS